MSGKDADMTETMRKIDDLQERLDKAFKRVNADPIYHDRRTIDDAISDNMRYFDDDRRNELCEILFAILDQIYERIVKQSDDNPYCNPMAPVPEQGNGSRVPEEDMLRRILMPLGWSLSAAWAFPGCENNVDAYHGNFTPDQSLAIYDTLFFLAATFPEFGAHEGTKDVLEYWDKLANRRDELLPESAEAKSRLLGLLMEKKARLDGKKK